MSFLPRAPTFAMGYGGTCRGEATKSGADHQQNTDTQHARVYYPLHPLAGQTLRIGKRRFGSVSVDEGLRRRIT